MRNQDLKIWLTKRPGSGHWVIRWEDPETGRTMQKSAGTTSKKEAERRLGQLRAELLQGRPRGPSRVAWTTFRERYEAECLSGLARRTLLKVNTLFDAVEESIKPTCLSDVTASRISKFVAELRTKGLAEATIAGYLAHLKAALNWAVDIGLLAVAPKIQRPKRAKVYKKMKGRAPTEEEFNKVLAAVPDVVGAERAPSWRHLIEGLWWSGLRLGEALELWWDRDDKLRIDLSGPHPLLRIPPELEKGHQDRLLPIAPEFANFLLATPPEQRTGRVFNPRPDRVHGEGLTLGRVSHRISDMGEKAGIVVHQDAKTGKVKYASAHDFRRAFGERWARRVMPSELMVLMRHESIDTTMRYYVGRNVEATTEVVWEAYRKEEQSKPPRQSRRRDSLRDSDQDGRNDPTDKKDANQ